jgi:hypothetical protein
MAQQQDANEGVVTTLSTSKDANKRLLDQIRAQTEEITRLTQQRVEHEERIEALVRKHQADERAFEEEARDRLASVHRDVSDRLDTMERSLKSRLNNLSIRLIPLRDDAQALQRTVREADHRELAASMMQQMADAENELAKKVTAYCAGHTERMGKVGAEADTLASMQQREEEERHREKAEWEQRHAVLGVEREDHQARTTREAGLLSPHLHALTRMQQSERAAVTEERTRGEKQSEAITTSCVERASALEEANREACQLESACAGMSAEIAAREQQLEDLQRLARESDDALATAESSGEHMLAQQGEHNRRAQDATEAEVAIARSSGEHNLAHANAVQAAAITAAEDQVADMERTLLEESAEAEKEQSHLKDLEVESEKLKCEISTPKSQYEKANTVRLKFEQELAEARKDFVQQRLQLHAAIDQMNPQNTAAEHEIRASAERFASYRREVTAHETQLQSRVNALEDLARDAQWQLSDVQNRLAETVDTLEREGQESADTQRVAKERQKANEDALERRRREIADEKGRLVMLIDDQRQNAIRDLAQAGQQSEAHASKLRHVKEEYTIRSVAMEREKGHFGEASKQVAWQGQHDHAQYLARADSIERELNRARGLLADSRSNLAWVRQERDREQQGIVTMRARLGDELRHMQGNIATSADAEVAIEAQVKIAAARQTDQKQRLALEMDGAKHARETSAERLRRLQDDRDEQRKSNEMMTREELEAGRAELGTVTREIEQFKLKLGERERQKAAERQVPKRLGLTNGGDLVVAPSSSLDAHIQRLRKHTEELQMDLNRHGAAVSAAP